MKNKSGLLFCFHAGKCVGKFLERNDRQKEQKKHEKYADQTNDYDE